ncbi:MAG: VCBS repeat-containing protein, partial [Chitinophagaceae bacterium]
MSLKTQYILFLLPFIFTGCGQTSQSGDSVHFKKIPAETSHLSFVNTITENDSINVFTNEYIYNGSGVGIGDFNNDGLQDIFFAGSIVSSALYINNGEMQFQDVTKTSGLLTDRWCTGVSVVDINNDGYADIYVSVSHSPHAEKRKNLLFINDGQSHFTEQAVAYGLADTGYSTQTAFLDYDRDGDLDAYVLNHRLYSHTANNVQPKDTSGFSPAQDKLYRNEGVDPIIGHPVFKDITMEAGIRDDGYGLGIAVSDINGDGYPDVYVANDYIANDLLWLNNGDGHFTNVMSTAIRHTSYNSMGVDAADINNDLLPDIATLDMLPETNERKKMMFSATGQQKYDMQTRLGYEPAYMRNMLQLNNGNRRMHDRNEPFFSEVGQLAGLSETDWSWSVLMADFDNDGWKDIHITNGLGKDVTNNDYATYRGKKAQVSNNYAFGGKEDQAPMDKETLAELRKEIDQFGSVKMRNYFFRNEHDLHFTDQTEESGMDEVSISNGAAYADLDNDGDLDVITSNLDQPVSLWNNQLLSKRNIANPNGHYLRIVLKGDSQNLSGLGARLYAWCGNKAQLLEQYPVRGFSSSVDTRLHFGLGNTKKLDSLLVIWQNGSQQLLKDIKADQELIIHQQNAKIPNPTGINAITALLKINKLKGLDFQHHEEQHFDFGTHQPLLQKYSQMGPCMINADFNADDLQDIFIGGGANQSGKIFLQNRDGGFISHDLEVIPKSGEDLGAVVLDVEKDGDMDLIIAGGSLEFGSTRYNQPRIYINDGKGNFIKKEGSFPIIEQITKAIAVQDIDGDGDEDIFLGGRMDQAIYPQSPRSYILRNDNGTFTDITLSIAPELMHCGMIEGAIFLNIDQDKKNELVIAGEGTEIRFFKNRNGKYSEITASTGLKGMKGLWRTLDKADIDDDGDIDIVAGNLGWNNRYHVKDHQPFHLFAKDVDKNGMAELIPAFFIKNQKGGMYLYPGLDRTQLSEQLPSIQKKYLQHSEYSKIKMDELIEDLGSDGWTDLVIENMSSVWIENKGAGKFVAHNLPAEAQFA